MALFHRDFTTAFLCNSFANFFGNLLALLMRYLRLNLIIDSLAGLLGDRHAYISLNIMAFFLRNCVRDRLLNGLTFFLTVSHFSFGTELHSSLGTFLHTSLGTSLQCSLGSSQHFSFGTWLQTCLGSSQHFSFGTLLHSI